MNEKFRTFGIHVGLVILCIGYIIGGAWLFYSLERPVELFAKEKAIEELENEQRHLLKSGIKLASYYQDFDAFNSSFTSLLDDYEALLFEMFSNPISASIFENETNDLWTASSALLFTATTIVPVGYGIIAPITSTGRFCLIVYAIFGIPLALATMANLGKFVCCYMLKFIKEDSLVMPSVIFTTVLVLYPLLGSLIIWLMSAISWLDSIYFCIMTIFMIGYGDMGPPIPVVFLIIFIVVGVMLVTISLDVVGANIIHHIHFMGRQMSKARIVAEKMVQLAQNISINKGLGLGMAQLGAFAKLGALMRINQNENGTSTKNPCSPIHELRLCVEGVDVDCSGSGSQTAAYMPEIEDLDFVDKNLDPYTPSRTPRHSNTLSFPNMG